MAQPKTQPGDQLQETWAQEEGHGPLTQLQDQDGGMEGVAHSRPGPGATEWEGSSPGLGVEWPQPRGQMPRALWQALGRQATGPPGAAASSCSPCHGHQFCCGRRRGSPGQTDCVPAARAWGSSHGAPAWQGSGAGGELLLPVPSAWGSSTATLGGSERGLCQGGPGAGRRGRGQLCPQTRGLARGAGPSRSPGGLQPCMAVPPGRKGKGDVIAAWNLLFGGVAMETGRLRVGKNSKPKRV